MVLNSPVVPGLAALGDLQQTAMTESVNTGSMVPVIRLQSDHQQEYAVGIDPKCALKLSRCTAASG